jgi:hypothetical protein
MKETWNTNPSGIGTIVTVKTTGNGENWRRGLRFDFDS